MRLKHVIFISILVLSPVIFISGCKIAQPEGTLSISELLKNSVYDTEVKIYGKVSLLGELSCPCFELTSGGEKVLVWFNGRG